MLAPCLTTASGSRKNRSVHHHHARRRCAPHGNECCGAAHPLVLLLVHVPYAARTYSGMLWPPPRAVAQITSATEMKINTPLVWARRPLIVPAYHASEPHALGDLSKRCCLARDARQPHALVEKSRALPRRRPRQRTTVHSTPHCTAPPSTKGLATWTPTSPLLWGCTARGARNTTLRLA